MCVELRIVGIFMLLYPKFPDTDVFYIVILFSFTKYPPDALDNTRVHLNYNILFYTGYNLIDRLISPSILLNIMFLHRWEDFS